jgi:hypothetical protein
MAKNDWDNRKLLAEAKVATFTDEEKENCAVGSLMEHYQEYEDIFHTDWMMENMDERLAETRAVKVLVVGDQTMRNLATMIAEINHEFPGALKIVGEDDG